MRWQTRSILQRDRHVRSHRALARGARQFRARCSTCSRGEFDRFHKGEAPDYELMLDIMFYMTHYPDVLHHPKEDLAFARIAERDADARPIVDQLTEQHARSEARAATRWSSRSTTSSTGRSRRASTSRRPARAYIAEFRSHMNSRKRRSCRSRRRCSRRATGRRSKPRYSRSTIRCSARTQDERMRALRRQIAREGANSRSRRRRSGGSVSHTRTRRETKHEIDLVIDGRRYRARRGAGRGSRAGSARQEQRLPQLSRRRHQEDRPVVQGNFRQVQGQGRRGGDARNQARPAARGIRRSRRAPPTSSRWSSGSWRCDARFRRRHEKAG